MQNQAKFRLCQMNLCNSVNCNTTSPYIWYCTIHLVLYLHNFLSPNILSNMYDLIFCNEEIFSFVALLVFVQIYFYKKYHWWQWFLFLSCFPNYFHVLNMKTLRDRIVFSIFDHLKGEFSHLLLNSLDFQKKLYLHPALLHSLLNLTIHQVKTRWNVRSNLKCFS